MAASCEDVNEPSDLAKGKKVNFSLQPAMKAQSSGIALNFRSRQGWEVNGTPQPLTYPVPTVPEAG